MTARSRLAAPSTNEAADNYVYAPADPVPTRGGTASDCRPGVFNQTEIEQHKDVLVYTGEAARAEPLEIAGQVSMKLFAAGHRRPTPTSWRS